MTVTFGCCPTGCTYTQGYWKNHYPTFWPTFTTLTLGSVAYTPAQLEADFPETGGRERADQPGAPVDHRQAEHPRRRAASADQRDHLRLPTR